MTRHGPQLALPDSILACLFDLDGVLTQTAVVHAAAWKQMFDEYLLARAARTGKPFVAFDATADYNQFVDGRPRAEGTRAFLASRGVDLPDGQQDDTPGTETIHGLSNRKNLLVLARIRERGVQTYPGSVRFVRATKRAGLRRAVVSSSKNTRDVLEAAGITDLFEVRIDGIVAERRQLAGKPAPDTYLAAAQALGVLPERAAVCEDALAGVEAGHAGGFGLVVGVDRVGQATELRHHGADLVVPDLASLLGQK